MVKLIFLFSQFLIILDFKLLDLNLQCFLFRIKLLINLFLLKIDLLKLVYSLLLLFNLARENMLTHFHLGLHICHSCMQVTLLRLVRCLRSHRLRDDRHLTPRNSIFKVGYSWVKPREPHLLKSVFCCLVNLSLHVFIHDSILNCWLVKLPNGFFAYLTQVPERVEC
jgi:hypothetical protein